VEDAESARRAAVRLGRADPLWPGQLAVAAALALYFVLPPKLTPGPGRLLAFVEAGLLVVLLLVAAARGRALALGKEVALAFLALVTVTNLVALGLLIHYVLAGGQARSEDLIGGGVVIWTTNLLVFAVWYWELDRGGPVRPGTQRTKVMPDLLFPQMTADAYAPRDWLPRFGDYLYVSLTNQAAFSPTDTMPLTLRIKLLMGVQGVASLVDVGIIVARAVNILGA
jgi:hypothetical protein